MRRLRPELWGRKNWLMHHDTTPSQTFFLTSEFLIKNNMTVIAQTCDFYIFPRLKILKDRHFDTIEVIEAES
jgi:hypothetical protein